MTCINRIVACGVGSIALGFSMLISVAPLSAANDPKVDDDVAHGLELVSRKCARCHAVGHSGASDHDDAPPFREVIKMYPAEHLAEALGEGIVSGHPDMPIFVFEPGEVGAIITYLQSLSPEQ